MQSLNRKKKSKTKFNQDNYLKFVISGDNYGLWDNE